MFMRQTKTCICHLCFKRLYTDHSCRMDFVVIIWIDRDLAYRSCHRSDCMPVFIPVSFSRHTHSNSTVNIKRPLFQAYQKVSGYKIHLLYPDTFVFTYIPLYAVFYLHFQSALLSEDQSPQTDTWNLKKGTLYTADELLKTALRYRTYWGDKGGITVSGGEPLLQIDFLIELFRKAKEAGVHTTLDTSGNPFTREEPFFGKVQELMKYTDLVMLDIKHIDDEQHKILTGCTNENILDFAKYLDEIKKPVWIRHVLVPQRSDDDGALGKLREFIDGLSNVEKVEVLPYHTLGAYKWKELGY